MVENNSRLHHSDEDVRLYCGDCRRMGELSDGTIHLVVTSPPYWDIKNYRAEGQIGLGQSYQEYLTELSSVMRECFRVLRPGRFLVIVIGTRISDGELRHIPADLIELMPSIGFTLRKEIIWVKPKGTQGLWQRGTTQFLKDKPYVGELNINIQHEFVLFFQRQGEATFDRSQRLSERFIKEVSWSVWDLPVNRSKGHPAPFPVEIPERAIQLYSAPGETVLDPFIGSGTTALAARRLGRRCVGYEISPEYCALTVRNLANTQMRLAAEYVG
jgi:DNA modification methylase